MGILDAIQTGLTELLSHKMRSMLTMIGVIFGVAAVIAMVSIGEGGKQTMLEQINQMGIDVVHVKRASVAGELLEKARERSPNGLKYSDAIAIKEVCGYAKNIVPLREVFADVKVHEKPVAVKVVGTTGSYDTVSRSQVQFGRFLSDRDVVQQSSVCVLGSTAKRELYGFDDPVGKTMKIGSRIFRVVGVMEPKELGDSKAFASLRDLNSDIYIPITISIADFKLYSQQAIPPTMGSLLTLRAKMRTKETLSNSEISEILVQVPSAEATVPTESVIRSVLNRQHRGIRDYEIIIPAELLKQSQETQNIFNIVMAAIASISLLVGGIGIMNIMLATVTQRTREIGVRRCIGATRWDIIRQFMLEALVITCMGGLIGVVVGVAGARGISVYANWRTVVSMQAVIISFGVSALVGIIFGMYPAIRAASVDPIEALRYS
ncbi:MAG TPA: ABC transporter permease [Armatimonadota bacterium]|jgi:putative ABC transport system permease protein